MPGPPVSTPEPVPATAPDPNLAFVMLEQAPCALLQISAQARLVWANDAARRLCPTWACTQGAALADLFQPETPPPADLAAWTSGHASPLGESQELALREGQPGAAWVCVSAQALPTGGWLLALKACDETRALRQRMHALTDSQGKGLGAQMALAIDLGQIAFWRHDLATNRMHYNAQAFEVLGVPPRPGGLSLEEVRATIHPDDLARVTASAQQALQTGLPIDMDARYRRSDGSWRTVMTRRVLQRDPQGAPMAFVGLALDVTERVEAQRRSSELAKRFELVTRIAGIGYWSKTVSEPRADWSPELRRIFGLADDHPVPRKKAWLAEYVHPDDRERVMFTFDDWIKTGAQQVSGEFRILRSDGQVRQLLTQSRLESVGADPLLFGVVIDVTEGRSAAQALREANERVALAARGAGLATWELDVDTGTAIWDEQMWHLRGLPPRAATPDLEGRQRCIHPEDRALVAQANQRGQTEPGQIESAFRVVWPSGEVRWLASRSARVQDESTGKLRRIGVNWDITDRRTAEVMRQERLLAQRESLAKSQFLARMSHELRTPLNAVLGFTQLLQVDAARGPSPPNPSSVQAQWLGHIQSAGQHLLALINDVLELSSAEGGALPLQLQPVALAELAADVLTLLQPLQQQYQVQIEVEALSAFVLAEPTRLRQVLLNLLNNAVKYNRPGGRVWLRAEVQVGRAGHDEDQSHEDGATVLLSVVDNGLGMNPEQMSHLFEPFNRLGAEALGVEGTGIGLAIVKSLVERMNGQITAFSTPSEGSCFQLRLQAASQESAAHPLPLAVTASASAQVPAATTGLSPGPAHRLLYVEDNAVNALIISELVARRPDLQLHVASDGLSGVRMARELRPALVLLDMQLPDIDGHEVLRRLRSDPATADIPCVALSANAMPDDIAQALQAGMVDYWTKPLDFSLFMKALDQRFGPAPSA